MHTARLGFFTITLSQKNTEITRYEYFTSGNSYSYIVNSFLKKGIREINSRLELNTFTFSIES